MNIKEKLVAAKKYVNEHKVQFVVGGVTVIGIVVGGRFLFKSVKKTNVKVDSNALKKVVDNGISEITRKIDEEIFTDLAPEIENYVLDNGIEHAVSERSYDIGDNLFKIVTVTVKQYAGD